MKRIALIWGPLVTVVQVVLALVLRERLPDPLAVHWNAGITPDGHLSFAANLVSWSALWVVAWAVLLGVAIRGQVVERRLSRGYWWGFLVGWAVLSVGMQAAILWANLDRASWTEAVLPWWTVALAIAVAVGAGVIAGVLGRGGPDQAVPEGEEPPRLKLRPGQRSVWVGRVTNRWLAGLAFGSAVVLVALGALELAGVMPGTSAWITGLALCVALVSGLLTCTVGVRVTPSGVAIGFGFLGWPVRRIRLAKIEDARSEVRFPSQVGGWGIRGVPGSATIMLRGGECLVIRYRSGGFLAVSVDDAKRGASLINALVAERAGA